VQRAAGAEGGPPRLQARYPNNVLNNGDTEVPPFLRV